MTSKSKSSKLEPVYGDEDIGEYVEPLRAKAKDPGLDTSAVASIDDAVADIKANARPRGLSPQQERAIDKLKTARRLLTGKQQER